MKMLVGLCGLVLVLLSSGAAQPQEHPVDVFPHAADCSQIKKLMPNSRSGVYMIRPDANKIPFKVYCEMRSDGGWTVIQRRTGASVSFDKNWPSYEAGFGHLTWDHWLGLKKMHWLTQSKRTTLRVDLWDHEGGAAYAEYQNFYLGDENTAYTLHVGSYRGTAGDAIRGASPGTDQNRSGFSTKDRDNDGCDPCIFDIDIAYGSCARLHSSSWWFSRCGSADLNGVYQATGDHISYRSGLRWWTWKRSSYSMKASRMMVKSL